jgi:DNA repair protein RecO (recombination protein O)
VNIYSVEALVLRTRALGEADRVVTLFSRERGKLQAVARGVRRSASRFGGRLDFFTRLQARLHGGRTFDVLTAVRTVRTMWERLVDPQVFAAVSYVAEVIDALCEPDLAVPELYEVLCEFQDAVAAAGASDGLLAATEYHVLRALGFAPELDACSHCGAILARRPLARARAWLSPRSGGLVCSACLRELGAGIPAAGDAFALSAAAFGRLRALRDATLEQAAALESGAELRRATRAFVTATMGRTPRSLAVAAGMTSPRRNA